MLDLSKQVLEFLLHFSFVFHSILLLLFSSLHISEQIIYLSQSLHSFLFLLRVDILTLVNSLHHFDQFLIQSQTFLPRRMMERRWNFRTV